MADDSLITAIEQHESTAETYGALVDERTKALDYYRGEPMGNEVPGRSQVISRDVFDTVEWIKPDLAEIFCGGEEILAFQPRAAEDVPGAQQETDYVNYIVTQKNDWFSVWYGWSHDALLQKVGYVKAYWDDTEDVTKEKYEDKSEEEYMFLMQDPALELLEKEEKLVSYDPAGAFVQKTYTCTFKRKNPRDFVKIENVPPENIRVAQNCRTLSLQDPRLSFVEHIEKKTLSELRADGFDVEDNIADGGTTPGEFERADRELYQPFGFAEAENPDPAMRQVTVRECWIRHDQDGDGISELRNVIVVGRTILKNEEVELVNIVALCPNPLPHQHYGLSLADAVMDLQEIKTALWRNALDNQYLANNGRYGVNKDAVNLDDMLDSRPGGIVRVEGDPQGKIIPLTHPTTGDIAIPMLEYTDKIGMKRTGVNEQTQGLDSNTINKNTPYATTAALMSAAQKRIRFIARIFAETGVKNLFLLVHALTLKHARKEEIVRLRNQFVVVDPRQWVKRADMQISVGLGAGDKAQQIAFLERVFAIQGQVGPHGLTTPQNVYNTLAKLTRAAGFKDDKEFWTNPAEQPPKQEGPPPEVVIEQMRGQTKLMIEQAKNEMSTTQKRAELELQAANDARDAQRERERAMMDMQLQAMENRLEQERQMRELQFQAWKAQLDAATKIQVATVSAEASVQNAATKAAEAEVTREVK